MPVLEEVLLGFIRGDSTTTTTTSAISRNDHSQNPVWSPVVGVGVKL